MVASAWRVARWCARAAPRRVSVCALRLRRGTLAGLARWGAAPRGGGGVGPARWRPACICASLPEARCPQAAGRTIVAILVGLGPGAETQSHKQRPSSIVHAGCGRRRRVPPSREPAPVPRLAASRGRVFVKSPHAFTIYCTPLMQYAHMCDVARSRRNAMKHGHDQSRPRNWRRHAYSPWYPAS